ncbi:MAG: hypothetical protein SGILL_008819 [Bacillariaceae sp.]
MEQTTVAMNSYMALRAEKIARNEDRLKELGLWKKPSASTTQQQHQSTKRRLDRSRTTADHPKTDTGLVRRSSRLSGKDVTDDKTSNVVENAATQDQVTKRQRPGRKVALKTQKKSQSKSSAVAPNSVRRLSLSAPTIVEKFLGKYMEHTGKETVITRAFEEAAASTEEVKRMQGVRLSFNKYCGAQLWGNGAFLWINMGNDSSSNTVVNEFLEEGKLVTWFGGSRMDEDSPVIQTLFKLGKQASTQSDAGIMLWCRAYDATTKKFSPYCCLGRLGYRSHVEGSYPVAFTWKLLDYSALMASPSTREVFQGIIKFQSKSSK